MNRVVADSNVYVSAIVFGGKPMLLLETVKNLDWQARRVVFEAKAPVDVVTDVRERLRVLFGL